MNIDLEDLYCELNDVCEKYGVELLNAECVDREGRLRRLPYPDAAKKEEPVNGNK